MGIRVNDDICHYFETMKELHQGDPLSPMLINIVADMLAILIERAKEDGQVTRWINTTPCRRWCVHSPIR
jgi:hypothetical protein